MFRLYSTNPIKEFSKKMAFRYFGIGKPDYPYMLDPIQLAFLINQIDLMYAKLERPLNIYEIGVARGMTTAFLAQHIMAEELPHKIFCIDTFSGFTSSDINFEITQRNKTKTDLLGFGYNDYDVWKKNFEGIECVTAIQCDISNFEIDENQNVDIVLADVDLYLPTLETLHKFYPKLSTGGSILVDDVKTNSCWDGAHQAYHEFCDEYLILPELLGRKSGLIQKHKL